MFKQNSAANMHIAISSRVCCEPLPGAQLVDAQRKNGAAKKHLIFSHCALTKWTPGRGYSFVILYFLNKFPKCMSKFNKGINVFNFSFSRFEQLS